MKYKGFDIDYSERDNVHIITLNIDSYCRRGSYIIGHSNNINEAQRMIDFHLSAKDAEQGDF